MKISQCMMIFFAVSFFAASSANAFDLTVKSFNIRSLKGNYQCTLFAGPNGFPSDVTQSYEQVTGKLTAGGGECLFTGLKAGEYAVAIIHDENGNGKLDTGLFGIPKEGWGVSRNAGPSGFGPPKYEKAVFKISATGEIVINLRYGI